ncbi:WecB/TagA/CpsF family glycosyltransferase [Paracoccus sp. MC1854]|nr:WecB/TagA/CpsF family glycosyltransferase [Paracoccus sp. MC1854]
MITAGLLLTTFKVHSRREAAAQGSLITGGKGPLPLSAEAEATNGKPHVIDWSAERSGGKRVAVNVTEQRALLEDIGARLETGRGFTVATLNLDHLVKLDRDPAFRDAYLTQSHVTADGNPIVWLSRLAGRQVELVTGSDLVLPAARLAAAHGVPVALFGATPPVLEKAARALEAAVPGLAVAARIAPPMGFDPQGPAADAAIAELATSGAGLCFLALGAPKQEIFAARAAAQLPAMGFLSIGAGLDFLAGTQTRAPRWVRRLAAEWLWRLAKDPRRLARRYADCLAVLPRHAGQALKARRD